LQCCSAEASNGSKCAAATDEIGELLRDDMSGLDDCACDAALVATAATATSALFSAIEDLLSRPTVRSGRLVEANLCRMLLRFFEGGDHGNAYTESKKSF
jgi:hypothetical protein